MAAPASNILAFDVGDRRVGVAIAHVVARMARPYDTLENTADIWDSIRAIIEQEEVHQCVVGLPRNLAGDDTPQTAVARAFAEQLSQRFHVAVALQDEALTSRKAEQELEARGKSFAKGDIDALAATYILDDYFAEMS